MRRKPPSLFTSGLHPEHQYPVSDPYKETTFWTTISGYWSFLCCLRRARSDHVTVHKKISKSRPVHYWKSVLVLYIVCVFSTQFSAEIYFGTVVIPWRGSWTCALSGLCTIPYILWICKFILEIEKNVIEWLLEKKRQREVKRDKGIETEKSFPWISDIHKPNPVTKSSNRQVSRASSSRSHPETKWALASGRVEGWQEGEDWVAKTTFLSQSIWARRGSEFH